METFYFEVSNLDGDFGLMTPVKKDCKNMVEAITWAKKALTDNGQRLIRLMHESKGKLIFNGVSPCTKQQ